MTTMFANTPLLSDAEVAFYRANGFVAPARPLFLENDIQKLKELIQPMIERRQAVGEPVEIANLINKNPDFLDFIIKDNVLDLIEKIIGPNFGLKESSAITKLAHSKTNFQWHSDFSYESHWEELLKIDGTVLVVAVTPSSKESGCVQYIPESHLVRGRRKHAPPAGSLPLVSVTLAEGFCSLHDVHVLHKSDANTSSQDRILLTFRFISTDLDSLSVEATEHLKQTSTGSIHLRGIDSRGVCLHSLFR